MSTKLLIYTLIGIFVILIITTTGLAIYYFNSSKNISPVKTQTNIFPDLTPSNIDPRFEFESETPYRISVDNIDEFNKIVSELDVFNSRARPSKIILKLTQNPIIDPSGLGYAIYTNNKREVLVSDSSSLYYPDKNAIELQIYISPNWIKEPKSNTLLNEINMSTAVEELISFQFTYLISNVNYNELLTIQDDKDDPRLTYSQKKLDQWRQSSDPVYPINIVKK